MKRGKVQIAIFILILFLPSFALAGSKQDIKLLVNREELNLNVSPQIFDEHLMVPIRPFLQALGAEVNWDRETNTVNILHAGSTVVFRIDDTYAQANGEIVHVNVPVKVYQGTTMVSLDFLSELLGLDYRWNQEQRVVEVESPDFIHLKRYSDKEKGSLPEWIEQWVESSWDSFDNQFRVKDNKLYLLSTFGEKASGGYAVRISRVTRQDETFIVEVDYKESLSLPTIQVITRPYDLAYVELDSIVSSSSSSFLPSTIIFKIRGLKDGITKPLEFSVVDDRCKN